MKHLILILTILFAGCSTPATFSIEQNYNPDSNLSSLATYKIQKSTPDEQINSRYYDTLYAALDAVLASRGYQRTEVQADFLVSAGLNLRNETITIQKGLHRSRLEITEPMQFDIERGGIVIMVLDPETGTILFAGSAKTNIDRAISPETREERIKLATQKILSDFPDKK